MPEHQMQGISWSGPEKGTLRIRCSCGWTEKTTVLNMALKEDMALKERKSTLRYNWERHAYTDEEILLLHELSDCEVCARGKP